MRKLVLSLGMLMCLSIVFVNAQDAERVKGTTTKSGQQILPQAGDFAIGIDATPMLKYVGNMFNNSTNNNANSLFNGQDQMIYGKYFLNENNAIRAKLLLNINNKSFKNSVNDDLNTDYNKYVTVEDEMKINETAFELWGGYEWRRGYGRLQGFYGVEAGFGVNNYSESYKYGNAFTSKNPDPSSWDFDDSSEENMNSRPTEFKFGSIFNVGFGGFVGVEYFVGPKVSIGGEFSLGFLYAGRGDAKYSSQAWNSDKDVVETTTIEIMRSQAGETENYPTSTTGFNTRTSGNVFMMFYF